MEREKCSFSSNHAASFYCLCTDPRLYLCLPCLNRHRESGGRHQIIPMNEPLPQSLPAEEDKCISCQKLPASLICFCTFPIIQLCAACKQLHATKDSSAFHISLPVTIKDKVKSEQDWLLVKQRLMFLEIAQTKAKLNETEITKCEAMYRKRCEDIKSLFKAYRDRQIEPIKRRKLSLETYLKQDLSYLKDRLPDSTEAKGLEMLMRTYLKTHNPECLELFRYSQTNVQVDYSRLFGIKWESRMDIEGNVSDEFSTHDESQVLSMIYKKIDPLLEFQDEERYIASFKDELSLYLTGITLNESSLHSHIEDARLHYFQEQFTCAQAKDQTIADLLPKLDSLSRKTTEEWTSVANSHFLGKAKTSNTGLLTKYRESLVHSLEAAIDSRVQTEALQLENEKLETKLRELEQEEDTFSTQLRKKRGRPKNKVKRPPAKKKTNGFQLFSKHCKDENRSQIEADQDRKPGAYLKTVSKLWNALSKAEQDRWKEKALVPRKQSPHASSPDSPSSNPSDTESSSAPSS